MRGDTVVSLHRIETHPVVRQFYPWNHENPPVPRLPVVIAYQTAFRRGTLAFCQPCHAETDIGWGIERSGVEDGNSVPTRLDLDREMPLEAIRGLRVMEDVLEGRIFEGSTVDITCHPVIIKHRGTLEKAAIIRYNLYR